MKKLALVLTLLTLVGCAHQSPDEVCTARFGPTGPDYWNCMNLIAAYQQTQMMSLAPAAAAGAWQGGEAAQDAMKPRFAPVWVGR